MVTQLIYMEARQPMQQSLHLPSVSSSLPDTLTDRPIPSVEAPRPSVPIRQKTSTSLPSAFPVFSSDGDISINISSANGLRHRRYLLHRHVLSQCSGFFKKEFAQQALRQNATATLSPQHEPPAPDSCTRQQPSRASPTSPLRYRSGFYALNRSASTTKGTPQLKWYEHVLSTSASSPSLSDSAPAPKMHRKPIVAQGPLRRTMASQSSLVSSAAQDTIQPISFDDDVFKDYDNLFRIFYNLTATIDTQNIATAYSECKALLHLADSYDALDVIGPRIDHHLMCFGNRLFRQIAKYPPSYLKLGLMARSKVIFSEALTHVVGRWPQAKLQLEGQIPAHAMDLIEDKVDLLEQNKQRIERKLLMLNAKTKSDELCSPSNDLLAWLATSLFRQWLVENIASSKAADARADPGVYASPGQRPSTRPISPRGQVFLTIDSQDRQPYLTHEDVRRFFKSSALNTLYGKDAVRHFERVLDDLKEAARQIVRPITKVCLQLNLTQPCCSNAKTCETAKISPDKSGLYKLEHLACTRVTDDDLPWVV